MKIKGKYLVIIILVLLVSILSVSYSYFTGSVFSNKTNNTSINTGKVNLSIDDNGISANDMAPIYDNDYEMLAFHKSFSIISSGDSLNSCAKLYLDIDNISEGLKSEFFKYKIINNEIEKEGNFLNADSNSKMLLLDNEFIESGTNMNYDLYIWVSYDENVDQTNMLKGQIKSNIYVEGFDSKENTCQ